MLKGFWEEVEDAGVEPNPYRAGFLQLVAVSETDEKAKEYGDYIEYFFNKCLHVPDYYATPPGYRTKKTIKAGVGSSQSILNIQKRENKNSCVRSANKNEKQEGLSLQEVGVRFVNFAFVFFLCFFLYRCFFCR